MKDFGFITTQWKRYAGIFTALVLLSGLAAARDLDANAPTPIGAGTGPWMNATEDPACPNQQVCAEWPDQDAATVTVCCIPEEEVGTFSGVNSSTCHVILGVRAL